MTATTTAARPRVDTGSPDAGGSALTGTWSLLRLALRRDRVRIPAWLAGLTLTTVSSAVSFADLYATPEARQSVAESMATPAGLAMSGPEGYLVDYNIGAMLGHQLIGFMGVMVGLMSILMVVRHTRTEEESGRAELVRANVVGHHAHLTAALALALVTNVALALLLTVTVAGMGLDGATWGGSLLYGAAHAAVGMVFAALAAVTVQVTEHSRGASGMALAVLGVAFVLRAAGDVGADALSWLSPIGWAQRTYVYVEDRWWPLLLALAATALLLAAAAALSTRRDVGAGLRQPPPGRASASAGLASPLGLALRLHRGLLIGFAAGMLVIGVAYGSIFGEVEAMLGDVELLQEALADLGGATLVESYASMVTTVTAIIASVYVVMATFRARSEEADGRAEPVLATALSRSRWVGSHVAVAVVGGSAVALAGGFGMAAAGALSLDDPAMFGAVLGAMLGYLPALWVVVGVAVVLYGWLPRAALLAWAVPTYAFLVGYLGQLLQFPDWMGNLSPFGHVPRMPAEDLRLLPLVVLTLVAAALIAVGLRGFRRRDLETT